MIDMDLVLKKNGEKRQSSLYIYIYPGITKQLTRFSSLVKNLDVVDR